MIIFNPQTTSSLPWAHDNWHYKILLHLHSRVVCVRMRLKPTYVVLCWSREGQMLSFTEWAARFWQQRKSLCYLEAICKVSGCWIQEHNKFNFANRFQFVRNFAITLLGVIRIGRLNGIWFDRHQKFHSLLGFADVRQLFSYQYYCAAEHAYCYDVKLISDNLRAKRYWMEICPFALVDKLFWRWSYATASVQLISNCEVDEMRNK